MVNSKPWKWEIVEGEKEKIWLEPSIESFYLLNRWETQEKISFLDLGCGIGRHTILFAKSGFNTCGLDLSEEAIKRTKEYAKQENIEVDLKLGDMLNLPYEDEQFDCILCRNVISHTDTEGMKKIISELKRILKANGECYLTLGSKDTWGFKQESWPFVDPNTRIRVEDGPENGIPHFYADYDLIQELFKDFNIELVYQIQDYFDKDGKTCNSFHYHVLIRK